MNRSAAAAGPAAHVAHDSATPRHATARRKQRAARRSRSTASATATRLPTGPARLTYTQASLSSPRVLGITNGRSNAHTAGKSRQTDTHPLPLRLDPAALWPEGSAADVIRALFAGTIDATVCAGFGVAVALATLTHGGRLSTGAPLTAPASASRTPIYRAMTGRPRR